MASYRWNRPVRSTTGLDESRTGKHFMRMRRRTACSQRGAGGDQTIFEFRVRHRALAERLLSALPTSVTYLGVDISPVMINLANSRLAAWPERAKAILVDG